MGKELGKLAAKGSPKLLQLHNYVSHEAFDPENLPKQTTFWNKRKGFPARSFGNREKGCCTRASQAILAMRMERIETSQTPLISQEEVLRVYDEMTTRLYGGGDTGAYEMDALSEWRKPDFTFRRNTKKKEPLTIDAFVAVNHRSMNDVKAAIHLSGAKGIKVCFALPTAWQDIDPEDGPWPSQAEKEREDSINMDIPSRGNRHMIGLWEVGSWGGHSMTADAYSQKGVRIIHSWYDGDATLLDEQIVTWDGFMTYCDEAYVVIDSLDTFRKQAEKKDINVNVEALASDVNAVSSYKIA